MAVALAMIQNVPQYISSFREQRLSAIRPFSEFFDYQRISRPNDLNAATSVSPKQPPFPSTIERISPNRRGSTLNSSMIGFYLQRITYNTRHFSGNYALIVAALAVYSLLTNPLLLISIGFLVGGFGCIQRFGAHPRSQSARSCTLACRRREIG
ncbi:hypothetical protein PGTUg99_003638 [Puccinia graminis f. sp. tritici]|uniref:PRA1 family protein n=1 Tax=Puccinia graminis f. sp. tritici TaxID=56615 RepID=A0A5B0P0T2_PUCGR|nr:hypothetical protein PGTUg99_003638 [Puccinia graminis f. sp. tritici]